MTVSVQDTLFRHVGNGVTTSFAYNCQVLQPNDLYVYVDGTEVTSGITKNGIGNLTGGTVVFSVAPANGAAIIIEREVALERTTDYQQNGDFLARVVNPDFNRIWMAIQQTATNVFSALRFPREDVAPISELPIAADRANKLLSFDASGNPQVVAPDAQSATALSITLASASGSNQIGFQQAGTGAVVRTNQSKSRERISVKDFGALGDGVTNDTAAVTLARTATGGRMFYPDGNYILNASPNPMLDGFTAGANVTLTIAGVPRNVSNAFSGGLRYNRTSDTKVDVVDAVTGNIVMYLQNGGAGTATGFYRGLAITTDSHSAQFQPSTLGGSCDLLWQRSTLAADPGGNRFNITYEETPDRILHNYATTASGSPAFDAYMRVVAGTSPVLDFPALKPRFSQGLRITTRADGNFLLDINPGTDRHHIEKSDLSVRHMTFKADGAIGFFGAGGVTRPTITGSRGGNAALASLLTGLSNLGLITDSTTA